MSRIIRPLVASAVAAISTFALSSTALAMPAAADPDTSGTAWHAPLASIGPSGAFHSAVAAPASSAHGSSIGVGVWVVIGLVVLALVAAVAAVIDARRRPRVRIARG